MVKPNMLKEKRINLTPVVEESSILPEGKMKKSVKEYRNHSSFRDSLNVEKKESKQSVKSNNFTLPDSPNPYKTNRFFNSYPQDSEPESIGVGESRNENMSIFSNMPVKSINLFKHTSLVKYKLKPLAGYKIFSESLDEKHFVYFNTKENLRVVLELYLEGDTVASNLVIYDNSEKVFFEKVPIPQPNEYNWDLLFDSISRAISMVTLSKQAIQEIRRIIKDLPSLKEVGSEIDGMDYTFGDDLDVLIDFNFRDTYIIYEVEVGRGVGEEFDSFSFYYNRDPKIAIYKSIEKARKFVSRMFHRMKQIPTLEFHDPQQVDSSDLVQEMQVEQESQSISDLLNLPS